jgi:hypothetical protein
MVVTLLLGFVAALATRFWAAGGLDPESIILEPDARAPFTGQI